MNLSRVRSTDWATGAGGLALILVMSASWYELPDAELSAWQALSLLDVPLTLVGVSAIAVPIVTALRESPALPVLFDVVTTALAIIAVPFVLWRVLDSPDSGGLELDRAWGVFAGAICVVGIAIASWRAMGDERGPALREHPPVELMPAPAPGPGGDPA